MRWVLVAGLQYHPDWEAGQGFHQGPYFLGNVLPAPCEGRGYPRGAAARSGPEPLNAFLCKTSPAVNGN